MWILNCQYLLQLFLILLKDSQYLVAVNNIAEEKKLTLVSILNKQSRETTLLKLHSIVQSSNISSIHFGFIIFESENFTLADWNEYLDSCFDGISHISIVWNSNPFLKRTLRHKRFETELIYARFYLPILFPATERLLYMDNDIIVNADMSELASVPMLDISNRPAPAAFVFEKSIFNQFYMQQHLNFNNSLVQRAVSHRGEKTFLNCGVILFDTLLWQKLNLTAKAEQLIQQNAFGNIKPSLYDVVIGDQGAFFLLLQDEAADLPVRFNLRKHPGKSVKLLEQEDFTGVVHFAGTGGGFPFLCKYPTHFPVFTRAAVPLLLSVAWSFQGTCPYWNKTSGRDFCDVHQALRMFHEKNSVHVKYNPGRGNFILPPRTNYSSSI